MLAYHGKTRRLLPRLIACDSGALGVMSKLMEKPECQAASVMCLARTVELCYQKVSQDKEHAVLLLSLPTRSEAHTLQSQGCACRVHC